jgi:hypothetical protein
MKALLAVAAVLVVPACGYAQEAQTAPAAPATAGPKACEELKSEIAAKLDAKGVKGYTLDIVAKDKEAEGKVVGTCEGGTKKIVYSKGAAAPAAKAETPAKEPKKP